MNIVSRTIVAYIIIFLLPVSAILTRLEYLLIATWLVYFAIYPIIQVNITGDVEYTLSSKSKKLVMRYMEVANLAIIIFMCFIPWKLGQGLLIDAKPTANIAIAVWCGLYTFLLWRSVGFKIKIKMKAETT